MLESENEGESPSSAMSDGVEEFCWGASLAVVATCNLKQWALDFDGNLRRTKESIYLAKAKGAKLRAGPELELSGYGCEDHFLESDTVYHCWESLADILSSDLTYGILCDIGMPVIHKSVRYNVRVYCLNGQIILLRPKTALADDGNQRESRWFAAWEKGPKVEDFRLPRIIQKLPAQQRIAPIGLAVVSCRDSCVASESCEELFIPKAPHVDLSLDGVDIFLNGSGSFHQLRKLNVRLDAILSGTKRTGGIYIYANQSGCDGGRLYYDGCSLIAVNGELVGLASQFTAKEVEVLTARVSLEEVRSFRASRPSRSIQASSSTATIFPRVSADIFLSANHLLSVGPSPAITHRIHHPMDEIARGPALWLWDALRRTGASGFFVPLSGGADSAAVATIVGSMCQQIMTFVLSESDQEITKQLEDFLGITRTDSQFPKSHKELANKVLHTCFMGTKNSSACTRGRAKQIASDIGAYHIDASIDPIIDAFMTVFTGVTGKTPHFISTGPPGTTVAEDVALQNIQARSRMCLSYLLGSLMQWIRGSYKENQRPGWLLILATGNVDESLRGYLTKYDCSSADLNPIGGISKVDIIRFLSWAAKTENLGYASLETVVSAKPTAELRPSIGDSEEHSQLDEVEMGMTYEELGWFGRSRKIGRDGPVSMFRYLSSQWGQKLKPTEIGSKVKHFFRTYATNRHKCTTITPSYHAEAYSPDDNRFDLRPFLYSANFSRQFHDIDQMVERKEIFDGKQTQQTAAL